MSRYIDVEALEKRLKHSPLFLGTNMQFKDGVIDLVKRQPTADVVEVVRCKDCKYYSPLKDGGSQCERLDGLLMSKPNDFCSYGERKEE